MRRRHFTLASLGRLLRHMALLSSAGRHVLRWRLETYGLYMPSYPYQRPWWAINPRVAVILARRLARYARWLTEMEAARRGRPAAWHSQLATDADARWRAWLASQNATGPQAEGLEDDGEWAVPTRETGAERTGA
jgi:hypothetical protein